MSTIFSKAFTEGFDKEFNTQQLLKLFENEIKLLEKQKPSSIEAYKSFNPKAEKKFDEVKIKITINSDEYDKLKIKTINIINNGGVDSLFKLSNILDSYTRHFDTGDLLSELITNSQNDPNVDPPKRSNPSISQVNDLYKSLFKNFVFSYKVINGDKIDKKHKLRHQIMRLTEYINSIKKFAKINVDSDDDVSPIKEEETKSSNKDKGSPSKTEEPVGTRATGGPSYFGGPSATENPYDNRPLSGFRGPSGIGGPSATENPDDNRPLSGFRGPSATSGQDVTDGPGGIDDQGGTDDPGGTDDSENNGDLIKDTEDDTNDDTQESKSFYDTLLSYFTDDTKKQGEEQGEEQATASDIVKRLDITGLFSKDKKFVPSDNDTHKIEIAESELKMLQDSEERLRQELDEQTERIKMYKTDIQDKISQQYALLEYEKKLLRNENKRFNRKQFEKYNSLVDMLKNRERFLDKREYILNGKRKKDLNEIIEIKKKLVSELLRQLDKEKNIIIKNKNKENSTLKSQLKYYKGNNLYLKSIIQMLESGDSNKSDIRRLKRTLKKRKDKRRENYTKTRHFAITL